MMFLPQVHFLEMLDQLNEQLINEKKNQLHLTTIVVKEFAECVLCISMDVHTDQIPE
jgi:hypothetical protein